MTCLTTSSRQDNDTEYQRYAKALVNIRHENIVSFMGTCSITNFPYRIDTIITNPVRAVSLFSKRADLANMSVAQKMSITCQVRY